MNKQRPHTIGLSSKLSSAFVSVQEVLNYLNSDCYFTRLEAAKFLRISIRRLDHCKNLPRYRLPGDAGHGRVLFKKSDLERLLICEYPAENPNTAGTRLETEGRPELDRVADEFRSKFLSKGKKN